MIRGAGVCGLAVVLAGMGCRHREIRKEVLLEAEERAPVERGPEPARERVAPPEGPVDEGDEAEMFERMFEQEPADAQPFTGRDTEWLRDAARAAQEANPTQRYKTLNEVVLVEVVALGRLSSVGQRTVRIVDLEGNLLVLQIAPNSVVMRGRERFPIDQIEEGTPVRATYVLTGGGDSVLRRLEVPR